MRLPRWSFLLVAVLLAACNDPGVELSDPDASMAADDSVTQPDSSAANNQPADTGTMPGVDMSSEPDATIAPDVGGDLSPPVDMGPQQALSAGCADGDGIAEGENTFMLEGLERRYIMRLPNGYTRDRAWPLVFALHGNGGNTGYWDVTDGPRNIRGVLQDDAVLIIAEAIGGNWRDYNEDPSTWPVRIESELAYFEEVLTQARNELCIDNDRIFSMGFSGGGSFSGVLGCRRTDIRAIAVGGSVIYFDEANCIGTPAAWITIGDLEFTQGRADYRDFFRDRAGCDDTSTDTPPVPCIAYDNCGAETPVHYCQHAGDHIWPDIGSQAMWDFFSQF